MDEVVKKLAIVPGSTGPFVLACQANGQQSELVATNIVTGKQIVAGSFQGGGWSSIEATREAAANCNFALNIQSACASKRLTLFACQANGENSELVVSNLQTEKTISAGVFQGGGWSSSEFVREAAQNCLKALTAQAACR